MTRANNSARMREQNRRLILRLIREKPRSRAEIAQRTGLTRAAVTILTDALLEEGLILMGEAVKSGTGRRPTLLHLNPQAFLSVGIDLSREGCEILLADFSGNTLAVLQVGYRETAEETIEQICHTVSAALAAQPNGAVLGVGICAPGPIDAANGIILNPPGLSLFYNCAIRDAVAARLALPIWLEKDTNALAIAEKNRANAQENLLFLLADHGIGCAIIRDGALFTGRDGMGGELGHTTVDIHGPRCSCGNIGCAELYASIPATVRHADEPDWGTLIRHAKAGKPQAIQALQEQGEVLATLCVSAVNLFEPHRIVLGGGLTDADFILTERIETALRRAAFSRSIHSFAVCASRLGEHARAYAAAATATETYFNGGTLL